MQRMNATCGRIGAVLVLAILMAACASGAQADGWRTVRNAQDLTGSWEGSAEGNIPADAETGLPASSIAFTFTLDCADGAEQVAFGIKADFGRFLDDVAATPQARQQGITKDSMWSQLTPQLGPLVGGKYYVMMTETESPAEFMGGSGYTLETDPDRSRLRMRFSPPLSMGVGEGISEIILLRKDAP